MSQEEEFLVSGAELKCSCGTITCILKEGKDCTAIRIRNRLFLPVQATKKERILKDLECAYPKNVMEERFHAQLGCFWRTNG